jgi:hypothetical protein
MRVLGEGELGDLQSEERVEESKDGDKVVENRCGVACRRNPREEIVQWC